MRRRWMVGLGLVAALVLGTAGVAGAAVRNVDGRMTGVGGIRTGESCGGTATQFGNGSFAAKQLGIGTYTFNLCITDQGGGHLSAAGRILFTTRSGARLRGTVSGSYDNGPPLFMVTVTRGTWRFAKATGSLSFGPATVSNPTNCQHLICQDWDETAHLTGTLQHVRVP